MPHLQPMFFLWVGDNSPPKGTLPFFLPEEGMFGNTGFSVAGAWRAWVRTKGHIWKGLQAGLSRGLHRNQQGLGYLGGSMV